MTIRTLVLSGGGGLVASVGDYLRFGEMLLRDGEYGGVRLLAPHTVALMTADALPPGVGFSERALNLSGDVAPTPAMGQGFGLGFAVRTAAGRNPLPGSIGNYYWTGAWGTVSYWNAFVANLEMRGKGVFFDPRLDNAAQYPVAAANPELFGHKRDEEDRITPKLAALHFYQLAIPAPTPPPGSFDAAAAERGDALFDGKARCTSCHVEPLHTEPGWNRHTPEEIGIDSFQADRSPDGHYRTTPLKGLWSHAQGGFYHDGRFATLDDVVDHYDTHFSLQLTGRQKEDLVEFLKSL